MALIPTLFFNTPRGTAGPTQPDPGLKQVYLSLCNFLPLHRHPSLPGRVSGSRKGTTFFSPYWTQTHQARLASSGVGETDSQSYIRTEGVELSVGTPPHESCQTRWWGPRGGEKALFSANTPFQAQQHLWNSITRDSLPLSPGRRQQTSHWIINKPVGICSSGSWAGGCKSAQVRRQTLPLATMPQPHLRGSKLELRKEREQAAQSSLPGAASGFKTLWPVSTHGPAGLAHLLHAHSEQCCSHNVSRHLDPQP